VDDGAAAPPSPATKAWWWRFVDAAGARGRCSLLVRKWWLPWFVLVHGGCVVRRRLCSRCCYRCANGDRDDGGAAEKMERHGGCGVAAVAGTRAGRASDGCRSGAEAVDLVRRSWLNARGKKEMASRWWPAMAEARWCCA